MYQISKKNDFNLYKIILDFLKSNHNYLNNEKS